jgi:DNA-binding PadR family transcriptional regulator
MERQLLLLGLLLRQEMHAYGLNEFIEEKMHFCTDLKRPTAYYTLDKMAADGLVSAQVTQKGNRPPRRVYRITEAGKARFFDLLRQNLKTYAQTFYPADIGIAFLDQLPADEVSAYLREKRATLKATMDEFGGAAGHTGPLKHVLEHNQQLLRTELAWLDGLIQELENAT